MSELLPSINTAKVSPAKILRHEKLISSYSSANVFPAKILRHEKLIHSCLHDKKVFPIHLQLNPTNRCMFDCNFCSCSGRDKFLELSIDSIHKIMFRAKKLGCESVTITGGGDPLMFKRLDYLLGTIGDHFGIEIGLVTNGVLLNRLNSKNSGKVVWCRVSCSDDLPNQLERIGKSTTNWLRTIDKATAENPHIDWAFSYVLSENPNLSLIERLIEFANSHNFTHTRLVCDILRADRVEGEMHQVKWEMEKKGVDDSKVIYQPRENWTVGQTPCYISLLKPVVDAGGYVLPCCGTQYALANPSLDYEKSMRMGLATDLDKLVEKQAFFDGSGCVRCYYAHYNFALGTLLGEIKHEKFV